MEVGEVKIVPPVRESRFPETNLTEKFDSRRFRPFYWLRNITERSKVRAKDESFDATPQTDVERTLALRAVRAELYDEFRSVPKADRAGREAVVTKAHARDEIARQLATQGEIQVNISGLGEQVARFTHLTPPERRSTPETADLPPVFFIPSISAGIPTNENFLAQLANSGREVYAIAYPEAAMGTVTKEFADAVKESQTYEPHTTFFKEAIRALANADEGNGGNQEAELWGYSTGAPIAAEILNDPDFQNRTTNAVFIGPASIVPQNLRQIVTGHLAEAAGVLKGFKILPKYSFIWGTRTQVDTPEQAKLKAGIFNRLIQKVSTPSQAWKSARVKEGGYITFVVGKHDKVTKGNKVDADELRTNPQAQVISQKDAIHSTPVIEPEKILPQIFSAQQTPFAA